MNLSPLGDSESERATAVRQLSIMRRMIYWRGDVLTLTTVLGELSLRPVPPLIYEGFRRLKSDSANQNKVYDLFYLQTF